MPLTLTDKVIEKLEDELEPALGVGQAPDEPEWVLVRGRGSS